MNRNRWLCYAAVLLLLGAAVLWRRNVGPLPANESAVPSATRRASSTAVAEEAPQIRHVQRPSLPQPKAEIAVSSYFGSGFGTTFSKKIVFKKATTVDRNFTNVKWFAVKSKDTPITEGIQIGFWDNFEEKKLQGLLDSHAGIELNVIGYETIEALGRPQAGSGMPEPKTDEFDQLPIGGWPLWSVKRKLVIIEIEEPSE